MSLRHRVLFGCAAVALVLLGADLALAGTFRGFLLAQVDEQLTESAGRLVSYAFAPDRPRPRGPGMPGTLGVPDDGPLSEFYVGIAAADGEVLGRIDTPLREGRQPPQPSPDQVLLHTTQPREPLRPFTARSLGGDRWRLIGVQVGLGGEIVLVGASLDAAEGTYQRMVAVLVIATLTVLVTLVIVAWWVLRQGVRPLAAMTATAEGIAGGALHERVGDVDERTEAGRLGAALNTMLSRIETAFSERAASEERLRRFVADASHELRTPLTSIQGYAELYRTGALDDRDRLDGAMRRMEQEAQRMGALVEDLLLLAKLDQGRPLEQHPVDLAQLVTDAVDDLRAVEPDRPVTVDVQPVTVAGDDARLRQAISNLLANVRAHTPRVTPVTVTVTAADGRAVVEVTDQGPGMPPEVTARVFERFYRADTSRSRPSAEDAVVPSDSPTCGSSSDSGSRSTQGAGLGLAIVGSIIDAHGGKAEVESRIGEGTIFRLILPLHSSAADDGLMRLEERNR